VSSAENISLDDARNISQGLTLTNTNPYPVSVWGGCQATMVSTFSITSATGAVVYTWKPTGASCNYLYPITINANQTLQLGAVGLGKNLTWDERLGTPGSPGGFVDPGGYTLSANIVVAGFNPSRTSCQPSGRDCDPSVGRSFNLQPARAFQIGSLSSSSSPDLSSYGYPVAVLAKFVPNHQKRGHRPNLSCRSQEWWL
jgi:hypothetical protein